MTDVFDRVVGQERAVAHLRAAVRAPVHAYLLVGPPGTGRRTAALSLAAALLCPRGGCGECDVCRRVLAGSHPDVAASLSRRPGLTQSPSRWWSHPVTAAGDGAPRAGGAVVGSMM